MNPYTHEMDTMRYAMDHLRGHELRRGYSTSPDRPNSLPLMYGRPIRLHWMGWHSDTHELQQHGWQFAEEVNPYQQSHQLRFRNDEARIVGDTDYWRFDDYMRDGRGHNPPHLHCRISNHMEIIEQQPPRSFEACDMTPYNQDEYEHRHQVQHAAYFKPLHHDAKKIFLEKASMSEIMDIALSKQAPEQGRIRKEMLHRDELQKYGTVAAELRLVS